MTSPSGSQASQVPIEGVIAHAYRIPTDAPEADGTFAWNATTLIVAWVSAGGQSGIGYTYSDACATNAKQSALVTWIPRAVRAGAEIRDLEMVGRVVTDDAGRATGVEYFREGRWQFQRFQRLVASIHRLRSRGSLAVRPIGSLPWPLAENCRPWQNYRV